MIETVVAKYEGIHARAKEIAVKKPARAKLSAPVDDEDGSTVVEPGVSAAWLQQVEDKIRPVSRELGREGEGGRIGEAGRGGAVLPPAPPL